MRLAKVKLATVAAVASMSALLFAQSKFEVEPRLARETLASTYFGADAPWFLRNIPFLEIDDPEIQQIYYYRWNVFRSHIRQIGSQGTTVLEFLPDVPWAGEPYTNLNDSASFHLAEGRWLRDASEVDDLIDHEYAGGGNDRHFSESIAAAAVGTTLVTGNSDAALRHLDAMQRIYNQWDDHFDRARNLYWIEPLLDATEYTIASIDASGAGFTDTPATRDSRNGFTGGYAYRPSINSYQYANALAIAYLATLAGKPEVAADYTRRAAAVRSAVLTQLWNPKFEHFTDRYQRSTAYVTAGDFIRGRELVGFTPWLYELPPKDASSSKYDIAWTHILTTSELAGPAGLRTVEPSYPKYMVQYRYDRATGLRECQWNGPSWPFQTSQALTGLANLLNDYPPASITREDYLRVLRQYTHQHFLTPGHPDIQEDYDPDRGGPIVGLPRSHHYLHSTYVDLILSGLIGIRPRADDILEINPLLPQLGKSTDSAIRWFQLQNLKYHGHDVGIIYDWDGSRYHLGSGLSIFVDGRLAREPSAPGRIEIPLHSIPGRLQRPNKRVDLAVDLGFRGGPVPTASSVDSGASVNQAVDGRMWFFPEIANGWSPAPSGGASSWYAVDFGQRRTVASVQMYFFADDDKFRVPSAIHLQVETASGWKDVPQPKTIPQEPLANGETTITFSPVSVNKIRLLFKNPAAPTTIRMIEIEAFGPAGDLGDQRRTIPDYPRGAKD
jgi:hypothetical protein